jgi:anti-anti-sigma regulatory factor
MPEVLGIKSTITTVRTLPSRLEDEPIWTSPANFTAAAVDDLQLALANVAPPWFLDWGPISVLDADAIGPMAMLLSHWAASPVHLRFRHARNLERVLRAATPAGNKSVNPACWRLRMDALRVMGLQDDFELVALEYCVTFEVSPPAWQDVRCKYANDFAGDAEADGTGGSSSGDEDTAPEPLDSQSHTMPMGYDSAPDAVVELVGEILGEATDALSRLETARQGAERLVVSCANLIRVDFSAAGSILNWVATRQSEGCQVQFREVHRLVAAFFHVIGINEHSRVVLRSN